MFLINGLNNCSGLISCTFFPTRSCIVNIPEVNKVKYIKNDSASAASQHLLSLHIHTIEYANVIFIAITNHKYSSLNNNNNICEYSNAHVNSSIEEAFKNSFYGFALRLVQCSMTVGDFGCEVMYRCSLIPSLCCSQCPSYQKTCLLPLDWNFT